MFKQLVSSICLIAALCEPGIASAAEDELPAGTRVLADIAYGPDPRQRFDVYIPPDAGNAPVLFLVHGGGWRRGWKDHPGLIPNKAAYWLPKGYILVSTGYRLVPDADPMAQARDIARALAAAQKQASAWGGDPNRFVLMGHSAGAHLVALLGADPALAKPFGVHRSLGAVLLDSGALDVVRIMRSPRHPRLFDEAFGEDPAFWRAASPQHRLTAAALPMLAVCSTRRPDDPCGQARAMANEAARFRTRIDVLPADLSHMAVNRDLGLPGAYTRQVDAFMEGLLR
jgi:arylformamidase